MGASALLVLHNEVGVNALLHYEVGASAQLGFICNNMPKIVIIVMIIVI